MKTLSKTELAEIRKIAAFLRREGVQKAKISENEIEIELAPEKPLSRYKRKQLSRDNGIEDGEVLKEQYSDEDVLFWSAGSIPPESEE